MRSSRAWRSTVVTAAFRLFVFDLDGTLVDSRRDIADAANALLESCGAPPLPEERIGRMVGDGAARLVVRAFAAGGVKSPPDALHRFLAIYNRRLLAHTRPYPGMSVTLDALHSRASLAVLTNKPLASTREILTGLDLDRYFPTEAIVGGDGPHPRKPDPAGLRHLVSRAGVTPDCGAPGGRFGDRLADSAGRRNGYLSGPLRVRIRGLSAG